MTQYQERKPLNKESHRKRPTLHSLFPKSTYKLQKQITVKILLLVISCNYINQGKKGTYYVICTFLIF